MKIAACFIYVLLSILYLSINVPAEYLRISGGINIITQIGFVGYLCHLMQISKTSNKTERLFFTYLKYLSISNCLYILTCIIRGEYWSIYNTDIFAYIMGIGFFVFLIQVAYLNEEK